MYERILVPIDGSATSMRGLEEAMRLAKLTHATLRLVHVIDDLSYSLSVDAYGYYAGELLADLKKSGEEILANALKTVRAQGLEADTVLHSNLHKTVAEHVISEAQEWKADLIVIGTHGRRGVRRMILGSGAEGILRMAPVPVLLVRAPEENPG